MESIEKFCLNSRVTQNQEGLLQIQWMGIQSYIFLNLVYTHLYMNGLYIIRK